MELLTEAPQTLSFTSLADHQSTTPASFYDGPVVLHYHSDRCKLIVLESELTQGSPLQVLAAKAPLPTSNGTTPTDPADRQESEKTIEEVDLWVTSDKVLLYCTPLSTGVSIPYPSISLHAIQTLSSPASTDIASSQGLYMQVLASPPSSNTDDDFESVSLTIIPTASAPPVPASAATAAHADAALESEDQKEETPVNALFTALSNCSNLHPDPVDDPDGEQMLGAGDAITGSRLFQAGLLQPGNTSGTGGLPPPVPGSGGWITAENIHEYFDEQGNWLGPDDSLLADRLQDEGIDMEGDEQDAEPEHLGPGAGHVRRRDEAEDGDDQADGEGADDTKWQRTE